MANRLVNSASTYLKQHADNPVDWFEWGDEAWTKAKTEQKPVFLSVGYAACHWCHVMAHECFEDVEVAEVLNRDFVCIKVDREERPDIDDIYMTAVQLATGRGGWPMSVFLTPDQQPFFAGTYFPKRAHGQNPGFLQILAALRGAWDEERDEILRKAAEFTEGLRQVLERSIPPVNDRIDVGLIDTAVRSMREDFDEVYGGFGGAPKFPPFTALRFLMRYCETRSELPGVGLVDDAVYMVFRTLEMMAIGGIRDHVGGGFHRYATDERWFLPHFEKMLSDNGQMLWLYARAARMVDDEALKALFEEVVDGTIEWLEREMRVGDIYASALDADTDGEEGLTYVWKFDDVSAEVARVYGFKPEGNFHDEATGQLTGLNHLARSSVGLRLPDLPAMLLVRAKREQPQRSELALVAWNALVISGLVEAGRVDVAERVARQWDGDRLKHAFAEGHDSVEAFLDGYAYFADALIDLGWDPMVVIDRMVEMFGDGQGFTFTGREHESLLGLQKPYLDNATPSGNGVAIRALRKAGRNAEALEHLTAAYGWAQRAPQATGTILEECLEQLLLGREVEISGGFGEELRIELVPEPLEIDEDGWAYSNLTIWIPDGLHINSDDPGVDWLIPTSVEVLDAYGEAGYPESETGRYSGEVEIAVRVKPKGGLREFSVKVGYQVCSETECYRPSEMIVKGRIIGG